MLDLAVLAKDAPVLRNILNNPYVFMYLYSYTVHNCGKNAGVVSLHRYWSIPCARRHTPRC